MADRRDRLGGMTGLPAARPESATERLLPVTQKRRLALLYVPPPTAAPPYVSILEAEGLDVLLANGPESAAVLLENASPALIIAIVPVLGDDLRELFRKHAPNAEVRTVPGLLPMFEESIVAPAEAFRFAVRAIVATAAVLSASRGTPRERTALTLQFAEAAANALRFTTTDVAATCIVAAAYEVPDMLSESAGESTKQLRDSRRELLANFLAGLSAPFPIVLTAPSQASTRPPTPLEIVEAAAAYAVILEEPSPNSPTALRKLSLTGELHPIAVEAVIAAAGGDRLAGKRHRIMIVESDPAARNLLALRLSNEGYATDVAPDGTAALQLIRAEPPSLIISETVLAGMDGYSLLDTLRREGRSIPFVFLSSRNDALSINKGLLLGASDFLGKPINTEVLLTKVQKVLGQAVDAADVSSRILLSDVNRAGTAAYDNITYAQLGPGVTILGRFRIEADLGEGGMGRVFRARDERLEEDVVLKVMKEALAGDRKALEHFKREIRLARRISHPAVVRIFDFFEVGSLHFVTMEHLQGTDLADEIDRRGKFPIPIAIRLAIEFFEGLAAAHDLGVVHRDIKPNNVFLMTGGHVKILDFGIAQGLDPEKPDATFTSSVIGTPDYMSPEQLLGQKVDRRTDLYSAGVMLYEMIAAQLPFIDDDRAARATARLQEEPPPPSRHNAKVPRELDAIVLHLLARDRDARYSEAREVVEDLRALLHEMR